MIDGDVFDMRRIFLIIFSLSAVFLLSAGAAFGGKNDRNLNAPSYNFGISIAQSVEEALRNSIFFDRNKPRWTFPNGRDLQGKLYSYDSIRTLGTSSYEWQFGGRAVKASVPTIVENKTQFKQVFFDSFKRLSAESLELNKAHGINLEAILDGVQTSFSRWGASSELTNSVKGEVAEIVGGSGLINFADRLSAALFPFAQSLQESAALAAQNSPTDRLAGQSLYPFSKLKIENVFDVNHPQESVQLIPRGNFIPKVSICYRYLESSILNATKESK